MWTSIRGRSLRAGADRAERSAGASDWFRLRNKEGVHAARFDGGTTGQRVERAGAERDGNATPGSQLGRVAAGAAGVANRRAAAHRILADAAVSNPVLNLGRIRPRGVSTDRC